MEGKHYEPLYSLNSFLKFERKIYQFVGIPFGRPIKAKTVVYFIVIFALLMIWRFIPILNLPIKWIPIVILLIISGSLAWLLADVGTEARNPTKYFRSVFQYQMRKLKKVTYYRGKEIKKLTDYDVSGHILFSLPTEHIETHARIIHLDKNYEFNSFEAETEENLSYQSTDFDFKALKARTSDFVSYPYESKVETENQENSSVGQEKIAIKSISPLVEEIVIEEVVINEVENTTINEITPFSTVEEKPVSNITYYPVLVNLGTSMNTDNTDDFIENSSLEVLEAAEIKEQENEIHFEKIHLTPTTLNNALESVDKLNELEEKVMYLKIGDIKKMSQSNNDEISNEEKVSKIALYIERLFEAIERRKQEKRFKERQKNR